MSLVTGGNDSGSTELSVVVPCYNEADGIESFLREWIKALDPLVDTYEIIVINDGSTDGTGRVLDKMRRELRSLRVIHQLNLGHGRSIRRGYEVARGRFILQVDSNGRYEPDDFARLWEKRNYYSLVLAQRTRRLDRWPRLMMAKALCKTIEWGFGLKFADPNIPFRLVRREVALPILAQLPAHWDAVNLTLSILVKQEYPDRVAEVPVPYRRNPRPLQSRGLTALIGTGLGCLVTLFKLKFSTLGSRVHHTFERQTV